MRAVLARGPGAFAVEDVAEPTLPAAGCVVAVEAAGVCAADRMLWTGAHPWGELPWPFTPGHELLGRVIGCDRADLEVGERVTAEVMLPCGQCPMCAAGRTNLCRQGAHLGSGIPGAFAERVALPARAVVHQVPAALPMEQAVLAEPMACALHAVRRGGVGAGDTVAVVGLGAIGALVLHAARAAGATRVFAVTRTSAKAALARDLGADEPVDTADVAIECAGDPAAVRAALRRVAPGGRVVLYGVYPGPARDIDLNAIAELKELDVRGGHLAPGAFPDAIALLASLAAPVVTESHSLAAFAAALAPARSDRPPRLKAIVVP